jgi:hypothetical protein
MKKSLHIHATRYILQVLYTITCTTLLYLRTRFIRLIHSFHGRQHHRISNQRIRTRTATSPSISFPWCQLVFVCRMLCRLSSAVELIIHSRESNKQEIMKVMTILVSICMALLSVSSAFNVQTTNDNGGVVSRAQWFQQVTTAAGAVSLATATSLMITTPAAWAADDATMKGTKKDPAFEACLSQCMYDCTKPKGIEQRSRMECLPECKSKCATTKAQLMKGVPIPK